MSRKALRRALLALLAFSVCIRLAASPAAAHGAETVLGTLRSSETVARLALGYFGPLVTPAPSAAPEAEQVPERAAHFAESAALPSPTPSVTVHAPARVLKASAPVPSERHTIPLLNKTSYEPDVAALLKAGPSFSLAPEGPQILIVHTHGSEAYCGTEGSRTTDTEQNVVHIGDVLADELAARGFCVLHDRTMHDDPTYSGSYGRSLASMESVLAEHPELTVIIDVHRDSVTLSDGTRWRSAFGDDASQVMLIATNGENGLEHPDWLENFKFALRLQASMEDKYPGLARPLCLSGERYNQQAAPGCLILEVGTDGNTLAEAENAVKLFADAAAEVLAAMA